ncbi:unnamed protein product [Alopecurus aequalis]
MSGGGGGGSSRPDAAAGGSFPAGTPRGAPSTEPPSLAQYLSLEPLPVGDHKHSRAAELRRALADSSAEPPFALAQGRPPAAADELRRIRAGVAESSTRAKERAKSLHESIQKLDKYQNMVTRRRQRSGQGGSAERASGSLRMGAQNSGDAPVQRLEERAKSATMSKRVRSSLLTADARFEGRVNVSTRQGPLLDTEKNPPLEKEKSSVRNVTATSGFPEDKLRGLAPGGEGWEKKMKRKRSVGTMLNRGSDVDRDAKPSVQHRSNSEVRGRSSDAVPFRHGASAGASGGSKMDGSSQQISSGSRYLQKMEMDSPSLPNERRERHAGLDKERVLMKGNKAHASEDMQPGTLSPVTKGKACRAPRTSSLVGIHSSSTLLRSAGGIDEWEEAPSTNKASPLGSNTNRKRPMAASASPPPVAWVGQRPQKMSRTRRANVVSPVSNFDDPLSEGSPIDVAVRPALETPGLLLPRGATSNNSQAVSRMDNVTSPACLSESEGSVATEYRSKEKVTNSGDFDEGTNSALVGTDLIFSSKKSRIPLKEELEDSSIRRQGRSGRGTMHVKGSSIPKEKLDNTETRKLVKSVRPVSEKNESKLGRPPTKKGSDRKASSRQPEILNCGSMDITGESEDDREELLAAANAARGAIVGAYAGPFWKKIEPMLTFIRSEDLSFLKNQITFLEEIEMGMSNMHDEDKLTVSTNYNGPPSTGEHFQVLPPSNSSVLLDQSEANGIGARESVDILSYNGENHSTASQKAQGQGIFGEMAPLTSRLLSALIVEDVDDFSESNGVQEDILLEFPNDFLPPAATVEFGATAVESSFGMCTDFKHSSSNSVYNSMSNGFTASSNLRGSYSQNSVCSENISDKLNVMLYPENGSSHGSMPHASQQYQTPGKDLSLPLYGYQYAQMSLHDRTLVELHSIDIFPEMPELDEGEDEDINKVILELQKRLFDQVVNQKKCQLNKLEKAIRNTKNMEERSLEQHAMNKLVERAYKKLLGDRRSSSHKGGLSKAASKAAKQLALAFAKRTLARCQKFEETEKSCFREPFLWSVLSAPLPKSEAADGGAPGSADRLKNAKLDRSPLSQGSTKLKKGERERDRDAKNSSSKSGRNSSGGGGRNSSERKTKMKPKQKLAQLSTSGNVLGRVTTEPASSLASPSQDWPVVANPPPVSLKPIHPVQHPVRNTAPIVVAQQEPALGDAGMDPSMVDDILDVPEGNDISAWFTEGLDDGALQDFDFSGGLEIPDDDLTQLGFM